ncbi:MAG TPA: DNA-directed RNA polymerase subunit beta', partial [Candidatus Rifleibacterium sp.]|nr:DNA-directed RNA polymerase subunit beta' [Candidatus Rifleibacterium sp.]
EAGDVLTDGKVFSKKLVKVVGLPIVRRYLMDEIQRVYRDQGVSINDKHIEIIVRQMLRKVVITESGDSEFLQNESVHVRKFEERVNRLMEKGKRPPAGVPMIQGLTKAAIKSKVDYLKGLKENLIIGKLIPAGTGLSVTRDILFKNLPVEVESAAPSEAEDLFKNAMEKEAEGLTELEEELFTKQPGVFENDQDEDEE